MLLERLSKLVNPGPESGLADKHLEERRGSKMDEQSAICHNHRLNFNATHLERGQAEAQLRRKQRVGQPATPNIDNQQLARIEPSHSITRI